MTCKPNLFIIGAMKSGTSSLFSYLGTHPEVFPSLKKETNHFSRKANWSDSDEDYLQLFAPAKDEKYLLEASTEYSKRPFRDGVAERLHAFNSSAKIIYVMRDPFERVISQYKHMVRTRRESRILSEAIKTPSDYLSNSCYAYQVSPYIEIFGKDSVYTETFESLIDEPGKFCSRLFDWLGIEPGFVPPNLGRKFNVSSTKIEKSLDSSMRARLINQVKRFPLVESITPGFARRIALSIIPKKEVVDFGSREIQADFKKTKYILGDMLSEWIQELSEVTGKNYAAWPSANKTVKRGRQRPTDNLFWLPEALR